MSELAGMREHTPWQRLEAEGISRRYLRAEESGFFLLGDVIL